MYVIQRDKFPVLFEILQDEGYNIVGPTIKEQAIVYDHIRTVEDLPVGWTDRQEPGKYRLEQRADRALFGYVIGPLSWKNFLFPSREKLWQARKDQRGLHVQPRRPAPGKTAFLGVRPCELHAIKIQDKVFTGGPFVDPHYQLRREKVLLIAVNCTEPGGVCFCASMNTGPEAAGEYDIALTEVINDQEHYLIARAGTTAGETILQRIPSQTADTPHKEKEEAVLSASREKMGRWMDQSNIKELLYQNAEHPQWDRVAERCLACANCTMACPTCFCSTVGDVTDLTGTNTERWRMWDSCFNLEFSYIHGGNIRQSTKGRYRQWMTHKLASWQDQFGTSGCVGCGRCITWCPVGIDITEEVRAIRENPVVQTKEK